jgi:hypothetical protein
MMMEHARFERAVQTVAKSDMNEQRQTPYNAGLLLDIDSEDFFFGKLVCV